LNGPADQYSAFTGTLPYEAWAEVYAHAREVGLVPFASCWDEAAVEASEKFLQPEWYKIGSADITHHRLIRTVAETGRKLMLSTGAATLAEIGAALEVVYSSGPTHLVVLACTLSYPCEPEDARLSRIQWLRENVFADGYGYSDHTLLTTTSGMAVAAGAEWLEKHFTVTPGEGGDHDFALDYDGMQEYVGLARMAEVMLQHPEGDDGPLEAEEPARLLARRSLHTIVPVKAGEVLVYGENVAFLRPGTGITADQDIPLTAAHDYAVGQPI
jgi:N-acetylneuraminate synthase